VGENFQSASQALGVRLILHRLRGADKESSSRISFAFSSQTAQRLCIGAMRSRPMNRCAPKSPCKAAPEFRVIGIGKKLLLQRRFALNSRFSWLNAGVAHRSPLQPEPGGLIQMASAHASVSSYSCRMGFI
jgi:hypothetical protein